jgi:hypothetical protein
LGEGQPKGIAKKIEENRKSATSKRERIRENEEK